MGRQRRRAGTRPKNSSPYANPPVGTLGLEWVQSFRGVPSTYGIAWSADGAFLAAVGSEGQVTVSSAADRRLWHLEGHDKSRRVRNLAWSPAQSVLATASDDGMVRFWDMATNNSRIFCVLEEEARDVAWSPSGNRLAITKESGGIEIWSVRDGVPVQQAQVHEGTVYSTCWSPDGQQLVTCGADQVVNVLDASDLRLVHKLPGHTSLVYRIALSADGRLIASASSDTTVRVWDRSRGTGIATLEGHTAQVLAVGFSPNDDFLASAQGTGQSGSELSGVRLWRCADWAPVAFLSRQLFERIGGLAFHPSQPLLAVKELRPRRIDCYRIDYALLGSAGGGPGSRRYGNAKVVLLGDTGVGKSGLGLVLSGHPYQPTDSTHGRTVWTVAAEEVEVPGGGTQTREVLLWDLAGQPGYRIIHQLAPERGRGGADRLRLAQRDRPVRGGEVLGAGAGAGPAPGGFRCRPAEGVPSRRAG